MNKKLFAIYSAPKESDGEIWSLARRYSSPDSCSQAYDDMVKKPFNKIYIILPFSGRYIKIKPDMQKTLLEASKPKY